MTFRCRRLCDGLRAVQLEVRELSVHPQLGKTTTENKEVPYVISGH